MPRHFLRAAALLVVLAAVPASAGTPALDGRKVKALAFTTSLSTPQTHLVSETYGDVPGVDEEVTTTCAMPRCYAFPFDVKPAKGVSERTPLSVKISWTSRTTRLWLQLVDITGGKVSVKAECFSFYVTNGTSATVRVKSVKPGHRYAAWVEVQQLVAPDTVTGSVTFPGTATVADNPAPSPSELFLNGCNA
jgi:hypothetical protein